MKCMVKTARIAVYHYRHIFESVRIPIILAMIALFVWENLRPVVTFSEMVGINITPYAFPHLTNDYVCQLIFMAGAVLLFCDAPFEGKEYQYMLPRAGRLAWGMGQSLYIITLSFFYIVFICLISIVPMLGRMDISAEWGKIWGTLAKTDAGLSVGLNIGVTEYMVSHFSPAQAMTVSFFMEWACVAWIGLLIYFLNKTTDQPVGTAAGAFFVMLDICIANDWAVWAYKFSPITLAQINAYSGYNLRAGITFSYGIKFFCFGIVILCILCLLSNYRTKIYNKMKYRG